MKLITIETPALGDRSYVVVDAEVAAVIDPQRDIDRVQAVLAERACASHTCSRPTCTTHCASRYRASIAASLLDRAGRTVVAIDDDWPAAAKHDALGVSTD